MKISSACINRVALPIPHRIFLDTSVISAVVKFSGQVFEWCAMPGDTNAAMSEDVGALANLFHVGARAHWDLVASPAVLQELAATPAKALRDQLVDYGVNLVDPQMAEELFHIARVHRCLEGAGVLNALPGVGDRELLANAIALNCDAFCTRDRSTIVRYRGRLPTLSLTILTPGEWWTRVRPWAALWA